MTFFRRITRRDNLAARKLKTCSEILDQHEYQLLQQYIQSSLHIPDHSQEHAAALFISIFKHLAHIEANLIIGRAFGSGRYSDTDRDLVIQTAAWLMASDLSPNATIDGEPLIHVLIDENAGGEALKTGVAMLLDAGVDIQSTSKKGRTILGALLSKEYVSHDLVKALTHQGASFSEADLNDWLLYKTIFMEGSLEAARLIPSSALRKFARANDEHGRTLLHFVAGGLCLESCGGSIDFFNERYGRSDTYPALANMLLEAGADVFARDRDNRDALSIAIALNHEEVFLLLDRWISQTDGSTAREVLNRPQSSGATPLFLASYDNNVQSVAFLLGQGADPNVPSYVNYDLFREDGWITQGVPPLVSSLLFEQGLLAMRNPEHFHDMRLGIANLHYPCLQGFADIVHLLLEEGGDPNVRSFTGLFPLYVAAEHGHLDIVEDLIAHGAKIDQVTPRNCTALLNAAEEGHTDVVRCLLFHGADPTIANRFGSTPESGALDNGHYDVAAIIRDYLTRNYY